MIQEALLSHAQEEQIARFIALLLDWNKRINLISRRDIGRIREKHIKESLWFCHPMVIGDAYEVMDLGSGGGLPGIPIKIACPHLSVTLVESKRKKAIFLREAIEALGLCGISVLCRRAEELQKEAGPAKFDLIVCRAVAPLMVLWAWSRPLLRTNGRLIALKGGDLTEEVKRIQNKFIDSAIKMIDIKYDIDAAAEVDKKMIAVHKR